ncbi:MAG: hypothetical protein HY060_14280 [Proteobacteria bacterium]|nr:hypothetical protein [Pseudomonadota bacterium]
MASSVGAGSHGHAVQGNVDHRARAPGSGYQGGPTAISGKGPPQDLGAGKVAPPKPLPKHKVDIKV